MKEVSSFDVLKAMGERDMNIQLTPMSNLVSARLVKAGTNVTMGCGGNLVRDLLDGRFCGGLILADRKQFAEVEAELAAKTYAATLPEWLIIGAVRYAIGRRSYVVSETVDWLLAHWTSCSDNVRRVIQNDLEEEYDRAERLNQAGRPLDPLGHSCDREQWDRVRALWVRA